LNKIFLKDLFETLERDSVNYLVLRGYQELPEKYSYDIDFSVKCKSELVLFFKVINNLSKKYNFRVSRDVVRYGLLKVFLHFGNEILKIDVFCSFRYAGLEYMNSLELHNTRRKLPSGIWVPALNYELAISLLKEILHNSRIRKDKVSLLRNQYDKKTFKQPFCKYFSNNNIKDLSDSLFSSGNLTFKRVALNCRIVLFLKNIELKGVSKTLSSVFHFFWVKYNNQERYDYLIFI
jgi:hypothetical protein